MNFFFFSFLLRQVELLLCLLHSRDPSKNCLSSIWSLTRTGSFDFGCENSLRSQNKHAYPNEMNFLEEVVSVVSYRYLLRASSSSWLRTVRDLGCKVSTHTHSFMLMYMISPPVWLVTDHHNPQPLASVGEGTGQVELSIRPTGV